MAYFRSSSNKPNVRLGKDELVLGVGRHAYVNWPRSGSGPREAVPTTNMSGESITSDLADGQKVEIMAWRPHARHGLSYQIRRVSDGRECWILAVHLRKTEEVAPAAEA